MQVFEFFTADEPHEVDSHTSPSVWLDAVMKSIGRVDGADAYRFAMLLANVCLHEGRIDQAIGWTKAADEVLCFFSIDRPKMVEESEWR